MVVRVEEKKNRGKASTEGYFVEYKNVATVEITNLKVLHENFSHCN